MRASDTSEVLLFGNYWVNSTLDSIPNVCQQNIEVTRSVLRRLRTVGYTLFCCSPTFLGGGVKRVIPFCFMDASISQEVPSRNASAMSYSADKLDVPSHMDYDVPTHFSEEAFPIYIY